MSYKSCRQSPVCGVLRQDPCWISRKMTFFYTKQPCKDVLGFNHKIPLNIVDQKKPDLQLRNSASAVELTSGMQLAELPLLEMSNHSQLG